MRLGNWWSLGCFLLSVWLLIGVCVHRYNADDIRTLAIVAWIGVACSNLKDAIPEVK